MRTNRAGQPVRTTGLNGNTGHHRAQQHSTTEPSRHPTTEPSRHPTTEPSTPPPCQRPTAGPRQHPTALPATHRWAHSTGPQRGRSPGRAAPQRRHHPVGHCRATAVREQGRRLDRS
ncbi:hypothetical protein ACFO5K_20435 [Nocardia halotolerans]|uniref:Uncharacterized protein n=1 Tax=Nocardia halotolerans TaxID=1755878 RepID=A0ABV8VK75_9NOCA